jgi:hypothetical protein
LLLAEKASDALFVREALSPSSATGLVQSKFECTVGTFEKLKDVQLGDFAAVCLLDPPPLPNDQWKPLANFVDSGGGVGMFLGRHARREELNGAEAQKLLPGKLRWQSREPTYLRPVAIEHPALRELGELAATAPWSEFPVFKYWELEAGAEPAQVARWSQAYKQKKPILFYWYTPQYLNTAYQLSEIKLPARSKKCVDSYNPKLGSNWSIYRCAYGQTIIEKVITSKFAKSGSPAVGVIKRWKWSANDQNTVANLIAGKHMDPEKAAEQWVKANPGKVKAWLGK